MDAQSLRKHITDDQRLKSAANALSHQAPEIRQQFQKGSDGQMAYNAAAIDVLTSMLLYADTLSAKTKLDPEQEQKLLKGFFQTMVDFVALPHTKGQLQLKQRALYMRSESDQDIDFKLKQFGTGGSLIDTITAIRSTLPRSASFQDVWSKLEAFSPKP